MNEPLMSIIVCTYNRCESLRDTMTALKQQRLGPGDAVELLIVDNNSNDETKEVIDDLSKEFSFPVRYIFEPAQGLSFARNRGVKEAKGEFIAFTDDDVIPSENWISNLRAAFMQYDADCIGGPLISPF